LWGDSKKQSKTLEAIRNMTKAETANQAVRKTKQERKKGIKREESKIDRVSDPIALYKTSYESGYTQEIADQINKLAKKAAYPNFPYKEIAIVKDTSMSMRGDWHESKNTPRAITDFTELVLLQSVEGSINAHTSGGSTSLAGAFLDAVGPFDGDTPDAVFILSDGYENDYEGLLSEVIEKYRAMVGKQVPVFHVSPFGAAEMSAKARSLGAGIVSLNATYKTLPIQIQAQLLEADTRMWLQQQVNLLVGG
jgi:hypothetical protein